MRSGSGSPRFRYRRAIWTTRRRFASVMRCLADASPARTRRASASCSSRESNGMRAISARYTPRLARVVFRVSARTSSSTASTSDSSGSSGTASSASRLLIGLVARLVHVRSASRHRQHVERIVDPAVAADLEVHVIVRRAPGTPDTGDALSGRHPVADVHEVRVVVGVHGGEPVLVLDLQHPAVARLDAGRHHHAGGRGQDRLAPVPPDVPAPVPPPPPPPPRRPPRP